MALPGESQLGKAVENYFLVKPREKTPKPTRAIAKMAPLKTGDVTLATSSAARTRQTMRNVNPAFFLFI